MATSTDYRDYIVEQLSMLDDITCKPMMGEYLLYYNGELFGGIYDNRLLIKKTKTNDYYQMEEQIPYPGAKPMYMVDNIDNRELLEEIVIDTCRGLKKKK